MMDLGKTFNPDAIDNALGFKVFLVNVNDVEINSLNASIAENDTQEDMDELIASIKKTGLQEPLKAKRVEDKFVLLSGHRRFEALKTIYAEQLQVKYNQELLPWAICPLIISKSFKSAQEELDAMLASNLTRSNNKEVKKAKIENAKKLVESYEDEGVVIEGRKRDVIGTLAGVSGRTVDNYLKNKKEVTDKDKMSVSFKKIKSELNRIRKLKNSKELVDSFIKEVQEIKEMVNQL